MASGAGPQDDCGEPTATLAEVDILSELAVRPRRAADHERENQALASLAKEMARKPRNMLQKLVETAVELCNAHTAGISLLEGNVFRWEAVAGVFAAYRNGTMPREASPCGVCIDRDATQLMHLADRCFPALRNEPRFVEALLIPFHFQGAPIGTVWIVSHTSDRRFDREDERLVRSLAEFASAGWQLWKSYDLAEQQSRRKDEFLAMLGHEIRNPLAAIVNAAGVLRVDVATDRARRMVEVVTRQAQDLSRMVNDLMDLSRITQGTLDLQAKPLELGALLTDIVDTARPDIERRRHRVFTEMPPEPVWLHADRGRLRQIVGNLIDNAAKYTPDGGEIWVTAERTGDHVSIMVRDTGIGIPPERLGNVFNLFWQVNRSSQRSAGGLGLGLTLVRSLAELHGGTVAATSDGIGKGSKFTVLLPALSSSPATEPPPRSPSSPDLGPPRRILLVEDNEDVANGLSITLALDGHSVRVATDGRSALQALSAFEPHIVLLDVGLPDMDGYEVARCMRQACERADLMIITLSGYGQEQDRRLSREAGCDVHLVKPTEVETLRDLFRRSASATSELQ